MLPLVAIVIAAALAGALITYLIVRPAEKSAEGDAAPAQRVTIENGEPTITLDQATQQKIGLATTTVTSSQQTEELQLFGSVVDVQELAALENQLATARAQGEQARAKASFDRAELGRLRVLNADNKNVSDRAVQESAAAAAADDATVASAAVSMQAALSTAMQRFGPVVANALASRSALYQNLISLRQVLVQIVMPPGTSPPRTLNVIAPDGSAVQATLLSVAPRVDPKLQGTSYFYGAPGGKLSAGMNVTAHFAGTRAVAGVVVPSDAVVSFAGKSWIYIKRDPTHFARREISGLFATNIPPGSEVVTTGAQQLLSEEMRAQLHEE